VLIDLTIVDIINNIKNVVLSVRRKVIDHITILLESKKKSRNALESDLRLEIKVDIIQEALITTSILVRQFINILLITKVTIKILIRTLTKPSKPSLLTIITSLI